MSLVLAPILMQTVDADWLRLLIMAGVSTAVVIGAALFMPGTEPARLIAFYDRVRPPGWWARTARAGHLDTRASRTEFRRNLLAVIAAAVSVFGWLLGLAQLLLQTASPIFCGALLLAGTLVVPIWWRAIKKA